MVRRLQVRTLIRVAAGFLTGAALAISPAAVFAQSSAPIKIGYAISQTGLAAATLRCSRRRSGRRPSMAKGACSGGLSSSYIIMIKQPGGGPRPLSEAAGRRQRRRCDRRIRHQHAGAGDPGRDSEEGSVDRVVRRRGQRREFHYPKYFSMIPLGSEPKLLQVQFQHIEGNDIDQFKDLSTQVVLMPAGYRSGEIIYSYEKAR